MRLKLRAAKTDTSPQRALRELRQLMHVRLTLPTKKEEYNLLANKTPIQLELFRALGVQPLTDARLRKILA